MKKNISADKLQYNFWFMVALIAAISGAPHGIILKSVTPLIDGNLLNALRMGVAAAFCIPAMFASWKLISKKRSALRSVLIASIAMALSVFSFTFSVKYAPASYVAILQLLSPIVFVVYSAKFFRERITARAVLGITCALVGAAIIVAVPFYTSGYGSHHHAFYPVASLLMLINAFAYPLYTVHARKLNTEHKLPMFPILGYIYTLVMLASLVLWGATGANMPLHLNWNIIFAIMFSGLIVSGIGRAMQIWSYERIGSIPIAVLTYLEVFLAILLPVFYLHETMTKTTVLGGLFILMGMVLAESHWRRLCKKLAVKGLSHRS